MRTLARAPDWGKPLPPAFLGTLITPNQSANSYSVIDVASNSIIYDKVSTPYPRDIVYGDGYFGMTFNNTGASPWDGYVLFLDRYGVAVKTVEIPDTGNVFLSNIAYGDGYFVVCEQIGNAFTFISSTTLEIVGRVVVNPGFTSYMYAEIIYVADDNCFYFATNDKTTDYDYFVYKIDASTLALSQVHRIGDNGSYSITGMAYDAARHRLFTSHVTSAFGNVGVVAYNLDTWATDGTITQSSGSFDAPEISITGDVFCISNPIGSVYSYDISQTPASWAIAQYVNIPAVSSVCHMYDSFYASTQAIAGGGQVFIYKLNLSEAAILNAPGISLSLPSSYADTIAFAPIAD